MIKHVLTAVALAGALFAAQAADTPAAAPAAAAASAPAAKSTAKTDAHKAKRADCQKQAGDRKGADHKAFMKQCMGNTKKM